MIPFLQTELTLRFTDAKFFRLVHVQLEDAFNKIRNETHAADFVGLVYRLAQANKYVLTLSNPYVRDTFPVE